MTELLLRPFGYKIYLLSGLLTRVSIFLLFLRFWLKIMTRSLRICNVIFERKSSNNLFTLLFFWSLQDERREIGRVWKMQSIMTKCCFMILFLSPSNHSHDVVIMKGRQRRIQWHIVVRFLFSSSLFGPNLIPSWWRDAFFVSGPIFSCCIPRDATEYVPSL